MQQAWAVLGRVVNRKCARPFSMSSARRSRVTAEQLDSITRMTETVLDTAALKEPPEGWFHTPQLRGEEKRLGHAIRTMNPTSRMPSVDKTAFAAAGEATGDAPAWGEDVDGVGPSFIPGTFVEVRRNEITTHGVVLGELFEESRWHVVVLASSGEVWEPLRDDVMFSVPQLTTRDLAQRCSTMEIAAEAGQLNARIQVLQRIRQVERAVEVATTNLVRQGIDIYSIVKSRNPDEWATTTVAEVARLFSPTPTLVDIFAAHKYLVDHPQYFDANHIYLISQSFDVRPASHIQVMETVKEWTRQRDGPLQAFGRRAMPVISANRKLHSETRNDRPSQRPAKHTWTPEDETILNFLHHSLRPVRTIQMDPYSIGRSAIMRQLDPDGAVDDHHVHMALVDLGVYAPWQDLYSLRRALDLDQEDPKTSPKVKALDALVQRSLSTPVRSGPLGPEDFYAVDPLDRLRHDFGDMAVYVVDDEHAKELDDGVSVEAIPGEPENFWVHVHVADPASTIPPSHILAQRASKQSQSAYFIHRSWPLFPTSLMFSGRPGFSLADDQNRKENRVLTFSSKINSAGELLESMVRAGIARNFVKLSYDQVDLALSGEVMHRIYPFSAPPAAEPIPELPPWQIKDLRTLSTVRDHIVKHRFDKGIIEPNSEAPNITDFVTPQDIRSPSLRATEFSGFPEFTYFVTRYSDSLQGARSIIAEAMKMACRTASRWCKEHQVPVLRRTATALDASPEALAKLLELRDTNCTVEAGVVAALATTVPTADYSLSPGAHWQLAVPEGEGYTRATSPLRRFSDLMTHYQIHNVLLGKKPHYSAEYLRDYGEWLKSHDRLVKRSQNLHLRSWALIALKRWMADPRKDIPDPLADLHAVLMRPPRYDPFANETHSEVRIPALGISAVLTGIKPQHNADWHISESVRVKIKEIKLGVKPSLSVTIV